MRIPASSGAPSAFLAAFKTETASSVTLNIYCDTSCLTLVDAAGPDSQRRSRPGLPGLVRDPGWSKHVQTVEPRGALWFESPKGQNPGRWSVKEDRSQDGGRLRHQKHRLNAHEFSTGPAALVRMTADLLFGTRWRQVRRLGVW